MSESTKEKSKSFVAGAAILGVAGLITKLMGAAFRIPLTNIIGAEGMAYYQTAYPAYVMLLMISTSGLPTAISRMVAERRAMHKYYESYRVFKISFILMTAIGLVTGLALYIFAPQICALDLEPDAVYAMRVTAPALLLCPMASCFRGFFQGRRSMVPTAVYQVIEQFFRVAFGLGLSYLLLKVGLPYAAAGASSGAAIGAIFGFVAILIIFFAQRPKIYAEFGENPYAEQSTGSLIKEIIRIAFPITLGAAIMPILNWIDTLIVKRRLIGIGYEESVARTLYGELSGMAAPIINFPLVFAQAVCMSIVPVITDAFKRKDSEFVQKNCQLGLRYSFIIMMPCALGLIALAEPVMLLLYPNQKESAISAAGCLVIYAVGVIFLGAIQTLTGILQGIGKQIIPVINLFLGACLKTVLTYILTGIPAINVRGAAIGSACAYILAALLNLLAVIKYTDTKFNFTLTFLKPLLCSGVMAAFAAAAYKVARLSAGNMISTFIAIIVGVIIYVLLVFLTRVVTAEELEAIPKLSKLARLIKRLDKKK